MQPGLPKLLEDVRDAAAFILASTSGRTLAQFRSDRLLCQAVERNFEIIGEAILRIVRSDPEAAARLGDVKRIIGFRNILIHGYDIVDREVVWLVIQDDLPRLLAAVEALLADAGPA
jgi:uncharacterized protein with HEPN domain